jgi:hypothetical protein
MAVSGEKHTHSPSGVVKGRGGYVCTICTSFYHDPELSYKWKDILFIFSLSVTVN